MKQKSIITLLFFLLFFDFGLTANFKDDPLGLGLNPTIPADTDNHPIPIQGKNFDSKINVLTRGNRPLLRSSGSRNTYSTSDIVSLMSSSGGLLTVWALAAGNWIWGYTPVDGRDLKGLRVWYILTDSEGKVRIQNFQTKTCLRAYGNGVIHTYCNANDRAQKWTLVNFKNQAVQIKNEATQTCIQTPTFRNTTHYSIWLVDCVGSGTPNLDQQWYIAPPPISVDPLFALN